MGTPNWAKLVQQGRAKAFGVVWSEEELHARFKHNIPAEYVRDGILTPEEYESALKADEKGVPLSRQPRHELLNMAKELELNFAPETTDETLRELIGKAEPKLVDVVKQKVSPKKRAAKK